MRVILYSRVSTDDKEQNPERQFLKLRQYSELHGHRILGEFVDYHTGDSRPEDRPGFSEGVSRRPEGIVVYSIDRFSRQHPTKLMNLLAFYKERGLKIISVTEPIFNMESDFAEPMMYFLSWWNNQYLKKLRSDVKSGLDRARAEGKRLGRPPARFNKARAYHLLFVEGWSIRSVADEVGASVGTIARSKKVWVENPPSFIKNE